MSDKTSKASVEDILSDVSERLKRVNENLKKLREGSTGEPVAARLDTPRPPVNPVHYDGKPVDPGAWAERLKCIGSELDALNCGTEGDFLFLGASLQEFYRRARRAAETSATVAHAVSDHEVEKTIDCLSGLLDSMRSCLCHSESETELLVGRLLKVRASVGAFKGLAEKGPDIIARVSVVDAKLGDTVETVQRIRSKHRQKAGAVIDNTSLGLEVLREKHDMAVRAIKEVSTLSSKITKAMGDVVESLQFHDITRQRVEHVKESLDKLADRLSSGQDQPALAELVPAAGDECEFAAEQLTRSRDELCFAVDIIRDNLRDLATSTAAVSEETSILTKGDTANSKSFLTSLGGWLSSASSAFPVFLEEYEAGKKAASAAHDAAEAARELCSLLGNDDNGEQGFDAALATGILASLARLGGADYEEEGIGPAVDGPEHLKRMGGELALMLNDLRCLNGKVLYSLNLIDEAGRTLSDDIEKAVKAIGVQDRFRKVVDEVNGGLADMAARARPASQVQGRPASRADVDPSSLQGNRGIWRDGLAQRFSGTRISERPLDDELGENVELF